MVCISHSLLAKKHASDGYRKSNIRMKISACCEYVGDINRRIRGLCIADNLSGSGCHLVHSIVIVDDTLNSYGHTNLDTKIGNRILFHVVSVVATLAACVSEEDVVTLASGGLGVDCNYDTLNCNGIAFLASHVLVVAENLERRYIANKILGNAVTCRILDGCGKNIIDLCLGLAGNSYRYECVVLVCNRNFSVVDGPLDGELYSTNYNSRNYIVACCGCGLFGTVHAPKKVHSILKVLRNLGLFGTLVGGLVISRYFLEACGEHTKAHHESEKKK